MPVSPVRSTDDEVVAALTEAQPGPKPLDLVEAGLPGTLSTRQVSKLVGVDKDVLYRQCPEGLVKIRIGKRVVWPIRPVLRLLELTPAEAAQLLGLNGTSRTAVS
jgi:hypothetical protein